MTTPVPSGSGASSLNGWSSPDGSAGDVYWRRPAGSGAPAMGTPTPGTPTPGSAAPRYQGPPRMHRPSAAVGWGPVISSGPAPRTLPPQDHEALDREDAQARAVTVGVGVLTLVVLFLLLLMMVIRAGTAGGGA